jgi:hypothetical protein
LILFAGSKYQEGEQDWEMEMEDEDGGLFNIEVSSDESVNESEKVPRDFQSEEDYQRQRAEWKVKVEKGEVCIWPSIGI